MSRRALTLLLASALAVGMVLLAASRRVPYVALGPGPTYNTLGSVDGTPVLQVEGRETFPTDGHLDLTTVGVQPRLTLAQAIQAWFADDQAVVPREVVFPPDQTDEQVDAGQPAGDAVESQSTALLAAARQLGLAVGEVRVGRRPRRRARRRACCARATSDRRRRHSRSSDVAELVARIGDR